MRAGKRAHLELPVARLPSGNWMNLPLVVLHGRRPGPTLWLSGAIHGEELNGVGIIHDLLPRLDARELSGTLLAAPIVNGFGVMEGSRYLPDRRDLNRSFPGSNRGSLASRLAHLFFQQVVIRGDLGIDLHTGAAGRENHPQLRCDLDHPETHAYAEAFSAPLTLHSDLRDGSLRAAACERDIPVLLFEVGGALRFSPSGIREGVNGILRVMEKAGMIEGPAPPPSGPALFSRRSRWIRARRSGFCYLRADLGERVTQGQVLAVIGDGIGKDETRVRARSPGLVIAVDRSAQVYQGDALVHVAELEA
ncbi:MAG: succinylglutamate desuccinylase/aspartoacylase family protein [Deltaproteobacteria bacterium]|nr:succinylglutamate desuccinylase/aspartoacylase family protein [Deltaproteobacteria bacterium]